MKARGGVLGGVLGGPKAVKPEAGGLQSLLTGDHDLLADGGPRSLSLRSTFQVGDLANRTTWGVKSTAKAKSLAPLAEGGRPPATGYGAADGAVRLCVSGEEE